MGEVVLDSNGSYGTRMKIEQMVLQLAFSGVLK